jgi:carbamoyltransferase
MKGSYLGPAFDRESIHRVLDSYGAIYHDLEDEDLFATVAELLNAEKIIGWFQGRMEFGPRALGNRSILGDARSARMQKMLNMKIKYRESFRPFAPAVLAEKVSEYFELDSSSPYMLLVSQIQPKRQKELSAEEKQSTGLDKLGLSRCDIPAITHVDYSARIQTVHKETNPRFHRLLENFQQLTGYGLLVNTSFNIRDEPVVCSPEDAYRCFMGSEMDVLVMGNTILYKGLQV